MSKSGHSIRGCIHGVDYPIRLKSSEATPPPFSLAPRSPQETSVIRPAKVGLSRKHGTPICFDVSQCPLRMTRRKHDAKAGIVHHVDLRARGQSTTKDHSANDHSTGHSKLKYLPASTPNPTRVCPCHLAKRWDRTYTTPNSQTSSLSSHPRPLATVSVATAVHQAPALGSGAADHTRLSCRRLHSSRARARGVTSRKSSVAASARRPRVNNFSAPTPDV